MADAQTWTMIGCFDTVNTRIDGLVRDMQPVVKRTFGLDCD
ncbi:hypothetical protein [Microbacterium sp. APC 3901]|nr:hypothetical protein [Microbacterium sp. APC 3901]MDN3443285.1 hypothetical protein [Microbacterium sp. APC 3901]